VAGSALTPDKDIDAERLRSQTPSIFGAARWYAAGMTPQHQAMNRAFDAMKQFAVGNEAQIYELALHDREALGFIQRLHPEYPIDGVRDPWPGEVVDPICALMNGKVHCSCRVGEMQDFIRVVLTREAARLSAAESLHLAQDG
jgi:hypothetical protein